MEEIYKKARARINLSLEVLGKREDGYHNIKSVFQKINFYDEIWIRKNKTADCRLETNVETLNNQQNIVYQAYLKLKEKFSNLSGVDVKINKKIPMQAGLAGGSADCATFLLAMNELFGLSLSKSEMESIGKSLGADVVPCLYHQAVLVEGIGEKITKINTNFKYYVVIVKPVISCDTKQMYQTLDTNSQLIQLQVADKVILALENNQIQTLANHLYNVFEEVLEEKEEIQNIKNEFSKNDAIGTLMSGSGSCVYGLFEKKEEAKRAYHQLKTNYETYICTSYNTRRENKYDKK